MLYSYIDIKSKCNLRNLEGKTKLNNDFQHFISFLEQKEIFPSNILKVSK